MPPELRKAPLGKRQGRNVSVWIQHQNDRKRVRRRTVQDV